MLLSPFRSKRKKTSVKMDLILLSGGDFFMAKKGKTYKWCRKGRLAYVLNEHDDIQNKWNRVETWIKDLH